MPKDIDSLLPKVDIWAPGCPEPLALDALRNAGIEFCRRTRMWRDSDSFVVSTPDCEGVCTLSDAQIFEIETVRWDNSYPLTPKTPAWLNEHYPGWRQDTEGVSAPKYVTQLTPGTVTVYPRATGSLFLGLILEPSQDATTFPDFMVDSHADALAQAAAGMVLVVPDADWSNPNLGAALVQGWQSRLDRLALVGSKTQLKARLRTKPSFM